VNVSSPNTPGLRALQGREPLAALLAALRAARGGGRPPLLLKIAPGPAEADKADIAEGALAGGAGGLILRHTDPAPAAGACEPPREGSRRPQRPASLRALHRGAGGYVPADRRETAADRRRRYRQRRGGLCQDPGWRLSVPALYGAGL